MNAEFEQTKRDMQKVSEFNKQLANQSDAPYPKKLAKTPEWSGVFVTNHIHFRNIFVINTKVYFAARNQNAWYHNKKRRSEDQQKVVAAVGLERTKNALKDN